MRFIDGVVPPANVIVDDSPCIYGKAMSSTAQRSPRRRGDVRRNMILAHAQRPQERKDELASNKSSLWAQTPSERKDEVRDN